MDDARCSHLGANLEAQLGVKLFNRTARYPRLTDEGRSLLADARSVADNVDELEARARAMKEGLEPELSIAIDVMYPMESLTRAAAHSRKTYPHTPLRLYVEALGAVIKPVLDRHCSIGVVGSLPIVPDEVQSEALLTIPFATIASPSHPSARTRGVASASAIAKHVQPRSHRQAARELTRLVAMIAPRDPPRPAPLG